VQRSGRGSGDSGNISVVQQQEHAEHRERQVAAGVYGIAEEMRGPSFLVATICSPLVSCFIGMG
jgi:hypothetical protein